MFRDVCLRHLARNVPFSLLPSSTYSRIGNIRGRWYRGKHNKKLKPRQQCPSDHSGTNPVQGIFSIPYQNAGIHRHIEVDDQSESFIGPRLHATRSFVQVNRCVTLGPYAALSSMRQYRPTASFSIAHVGQHRSCRHSSSNVYALSDPPIRS